MDDPDSSRYSVTSPTVVPVGVNNFSSLIGANACLEYLVSCTVTDLTGNLVWAEISGTALIGMGLPASVTSFFLQEKTGVSSRG
jgi:hypothetical protein